MNLQDSQESNQQQAIEPVALEASELCFVTSVHLPTKTFFAQLCKNTLEELNELDEAINNYCLKIEGEQRGQTATKKVRPGDYVCAKYSNGLWYRSLVLDRNKATQTYSLQMIDYGNFQVANRDEILVIGNPDQLAYFKRKPFGITCFIQDTNEVDHEEAARALNCLSNNYLLINILGQQSKLQYMVDIPKVCYNMPFWDKFDPGTAELLRKSSHRGRGRAIQQQQHHQEEGDQEDEAFLDEESLDELSVSM